MAESWIDMSKDGTVVQQDNSHGRKCRHASEQNYAELSLCGGVGLLIPASWIGYAAKEIADKCEWKEEGVGEGRGVVYVLYNGDLVGCALMYSLEPHITLPYWACLVAQTATYGSANERLETRQVLSAYVFSRFSCCF